MFLIDTSVWIWALHPDGIPAIRQRVAEILAERDGATTPMVLLELLSGARSEKDYRELLEELSVLQQFPASEAVWTRSYHSAFDLRRQGLPRRPPMC